MTTSASEFFETLQSRIDASKTAGMRSSYVFEIDGAGTWRVEVNDGDIRLREGGGDADCTISMPDAVFRKIASGEESATAAYVSGRLSVRGELAAAMELQNLF